MATGDVRELYYSYSEGLNDGVRSIRVDYLAEGLTPTQAIEATGVPRYGDARVGQPTLLARTITATPRGSDSIVSVSFVPEQYLGGSIPPVNQFAEGFIGKDVSFEYEDVNIPLFIQTGVLSTDANGDLIAKTVYDTGEGEIPFRKFVAYYRVPIAIKLLGGTTLQDVFGLTRRILEQTGKIHKIFDEDLVFSCEGIEQQDEETFSAVYRWYKDPGIPNTLFDSFDDPNLAPNLGRIGAYVYPYSDSEFLLPPFKGVAVAGNTNPEVPPRVTFFDKYKRDDDGWVNLPGIVT